MKKKMMKNHLKSHIHRSSQVSYTSATPPRRCTTRPHLRWHYYYTTRAAEYSFVFNLETSLVNSPVSSTYIHSLLPTFYSSILFIYAYITTHLKMATTTIFTPLKKAPPPSNKYILPQLFDGKKDMKDKLIVFHMPSQFCS